MRKPFYVEQHDGHTPSFGERGEGVSQSLAQGAPFGVAIGTAGPAGQLGNERLGASHGTSPPPVGRGVRDDAHQPGSERPAGVVLIQLDEGRQERILGGVIRIIGILQHRARHAPCLRGVPLHQETKGLPVSGPGPSRQFGLVAQGYTRAPR